MCHYFCRKPHIHYTGYGYTTCGRVIGRGLFKSIILAFIRQTEEDDKRSFGHSSWSKNLECLEFKERVYTLRIIITSCQLVSL